MWFTAQLAILLALLSLFARSAPAPTRLTATGLSCKEATHTFDEPGANLFPQLNRIDDYYDGVTYSPFVFASKSPLTGNIGGLIPVSAPNIAVTSIADNLLSGSITLQPFGSISTTSGPFFDVVGGYFGCFLDAVNPTVDGGPLACTITVTGIDKENKPIAFDAIDFTPSKPSGTLGSNMKPFALADRFKNVKSLNFGIATSELLVTTTALAFDNITVCTYG